MGEDTEKQEKEYGLIPDNQILVNGRSSPYLMSKDKWPTLTLSTEIKTQVFAHRKDKMVVPRIRCCSQSSLGVRLGF
jgi:hypothetical protein